MNRRTIKARLQDMKEAIEGILDMLDKTSFEQFTQSWQIQRATERGLEIISEASRALSDEVKVAAPEIPWRQIAALGNILRHEYQRVEPALIWNIAQDHLTDLHKAVERLLQNISEQF